jgi:hypothetical protein
MPSLKPQVSRPAPVEFKFEIPPPTVCVVHHKRNAVAILTQGPDGARLDLLVGVTPFDRELVGLDDSLREYARGPDDVDFVGMVDRVPSYRRGLTPELAQLAQKCVESYRRPHARSRGKDTREWCFYWLAFELGLPVRSTEPNPERALARRLRRARTRLQHPA